MIDAAGMRAEATPADRSDAEFDALRGIRYGASIGSLVRGYGPSVDRGREESDLSTDDATVEGRSRSERQLVERCLAGDRLAQRQLFVGNKRTIRATLFRVLGANADIEDLSQEVIFSVFRGLAAFRGECSLATWIHLCTVRAAFHYVRKQVGRRRRDFASAPTSDEYRIEERLIAREAVRRLTRALGRLEESQRETLVLSAIEGRSLADVARQTDVSLVACKARLQRARRLLQERAQRDPILAAYVRH